MRKTTLRSTHVTLQMQSQVQTRTPASRRKRSGTTFFGSIILLKLLDLHLNDCASKSISCACSDSGMAERTSCRWWTCEAVRKRVDS
eukprot:6487459-Amphidinium_carterae.2